MKDFSAIYADRTGKSKELYAQAQSRMPGGVTTPIRSLIKPHPFFVKRAEGGKLWDVDGNEYLDFNNCYGAIIAGHANPVINEAISQQIKDGTLFGVPHENESKLVDELKKRYPDMDGFRFTNSGAESTLYAVRLARAYTGKDKIIKFEGAYHGSHDYLYVSHHPPVGKMGPEWAPSTYVATSGVPEGVAKDIIVAPFNNLEALEDILKKNDGEVAGLMVEPVLGNCGLAMPEDGYLQAVRKLTKKYNVALIFDEVKVGLRIAPGGAVEYFGVVPDIVCLAKILGGGMQLGAYGYTKELASTIAPVGDMMHAGTYNGHPVSVAAGLAVLTEILDKEAYTYLNGLSGQLQDGLREILKRQNIPGIVQGIGSMSTVLFTELDKVTNYREAILSDKDMFMKLYMGCLAKGLFLMGPLWSEECVLSTAHKPEDINKALNIIDETLKEIREG